MFFIFRQQYSFWSKLAFGIINNANSQEPSKWPSANQKTASNDERNKKIQKYLGPLDMSRASDVSSATFDIRSRTEVTLKLHSGCWLLVRSARHSPSLSAGQPSRSHSRTLCGRDRFGYASDTDTTSPHIPRYRYECANGK